MALCVAGAPNHKFRIAAILLVGFLISVLEVTDGKSIDCEADGKSIGLCNGRLGNDLPSERDTVSLYIRNEVTKMRIYDPNQATLKALKGTNIELMLGVPNGDLQSLSDPSAASDWVQTNIVAYSPGVKFRYIAVGNEVPATDEAAQYVLPAMKNIDRAIKSTNLNIKVSTSIQTSLLGNSYPPSAGVFSDEAGPYIEPILSFLKENNGPLLANIYPYFSCIGDPKDIQLSYCLFTSPDNVVQDNELGYQNLFDASLDALYAAMETAGYPEVEIVVSETGWPSSGGDAATVENAGTYYKNIICHVEKGTPKRPGKPIETYLFAMFNENQKGPAETERHFGLFLPNQKPKYQFC